MLFLYWWGHMGINYLHQQNIFRYINHVLGVVDMGNLNFLLLSYLEVDGRNCRVKREDPFKYDKPFSEARVPKGSPGWPLRP